MSRRRKREREREKELREFRLDRESRREQTTAIDDGSRLITTLYTVMRA